MKVDGKTVLTKTIERTIPLMLPVDEGFDIGMDMGSPVDDQDYQVPFHFTGKIDKLVFSVAPPKLTPEDIQKLKEAERKRADGG